MSAHSSLAKASCALLLVAFASMNGSQTSAQDTCGHSVALLEGRTSIPGYQQGPYIFVERLVLYKPSGAGFAGNWVGTHYEQVHTYPFNLDRRAIDAMIAAPPTFMAGVEAVCLPDVPNPNTIRIQCDGRFPFDVRGESVYWQGSNSPIGVLTGNQLTISFSTDPAVAPMFSPMMGEIYPATAQPGFAISVGRIVIHPDGLSSELDIRVAIEPAISQFTDTLVVTPIFGGFPPVPTWTVDEINDVWTVKFNLLGNDTDRREATEDIDVIASARLNDCVYRKTWNLAEVLGLYGVAP